MKNLRILPIILSAAILLCGCEKDEETQVVSDVFFSDNNTAFQNVAEGSPVIVELQRTNPAKAITVTIGVGKNQDNMFVIPETVEFPAGKETVQVEIPFKGRSVDESYTMDLKLRSSQLNKSYTASGSISVTASLLPQSVRVLTISSPATETIYPGQILDFTIARVGSEGPLTVPFTVENNDANVFGLPSQVTFDDGESEKTFPVTVSEDIVFSTSYGFKLSVKDGVNKYVDAGNQIFSYEWNRDVIEGYLTLSFNYAGMDYLEPGTNMQVEITIDKASAEAIRIPLIVTENESDMFVVPESVTIAAGQTTASVPLRLKNGAANGSEYKIGLKPGVATKYIFKSENSLEPPVFERTITATLSIIQAKFETTTPASIVPGSFGYLGVSILAAREQDIVVPLVLDDDAGGMFSIPATVTIPAGTLSGFFPVHISPSAVRGTTYKISYRIGESLEYNFVKENASSFTDRPAVTNKNMRITADWVPYAKCSVQSGYMASLGYTLDYEIDMLYNSSTGQYKFAAVYKKGGDMAILWNEGEAAFESASTSSYSVPDGETTITAKTWMSGWGWNVACTPSNDRARVYYTPATKTFTMTNYHLDGMTSVGFGWFTDHISIVQVY